jgi:hypothetical protein
MMAVPMVPFIGPGVASWGAGRRKGCGGWWSSIKTLLHQLREAERERGCWGCGRSVASFHRSGGGAGGESERHTTMTAREAAEVLSQEEDDGERGPVGFTGWAELGCSN